MSALKAVFASALLLAAIDLPAGAVPAFTPENGIRISSAVLQAATGSYPTLRAYYIRNSSHVLSAITADGMTFNEEAGVRLSSLTVPALDIGISSITGLSILPLNSGGFRMLYSVIGTTGSYRIYSATSADGLAWANEAGAKINSSTTFSGMPSLVKLGTGDWRLYYIQNSIAGNQPANYRIYTALSTNEGASFGSASQAHSAQAGEVSAVLRTDNRVRLYYTAPAAGSSSNTTIVSALSTDANGTSFSTESDVRLSTPVTSGSLAYPFVLRSTEAAPSYRWRMYYDFNGPGLSTGNVHSALTTAPDPQSISPSTVLNASPAVSLTISGEVFSPSPSVKLTSGGQADITGTAVTRSNDQTITATFNVQDKAPGFWNVVVANSDGVSKTLANALTIDFSNGSASVTDNLLRPRLGGTAKIAVVTYNAGHLTVKLYTLGGALVSTLFDGERAAGTLNLTWDGKTAQGNTVASGVYLLKTTGPKINVINKIVVIK